MTIQPGKTVIITGAGGGLGKALALCCAQRGYDLALIDTDEKNLALLAGELQNTGIHATYHAADVGNEQAIIAVRDEILQKHKNISWLINNAAVSISIPFEEIDMQRFRNLFEINFWGSVYTCKHFLPYLQQNKHARIANIISGFATMGFPGKTSYGSSKAAVMGFSSSLQTELQGSNVKVCIVIPPPLDTNLVRNSDDANIDRKAQEIAFLEKHGMPVAAAAERMIERIALGKYRIVVGSSNYWSDVAARFFPTTLSKIINRYRKRIGFGLEK